MNTIQGDSISYTGISTCQLDSISYFKQLNVDYKLCLHNEKPDIDQIVKVWIETTIIDNEVIKTPIGTSSEGQALTGFKLLVCGDISLKIEYLSCDSTQSVHTANTVVPFCGYIVMPKNSNTNALIKSNIFVEDIISTKLDPRCIYNNITIMLIANIC